jgi:small subunit ribosomal protein S6
MKRKYEGLIVIKSRGTDEALEALVTKVGSEMEKEGAKLEQIDKLGKRRFPYGSKGEVDGYYACYYIEADPQTLTRIQNRLRLSEEIHQQNFFTP